MLNQKPILSNDSLYKKWRLLIKRAKQFDKSKNFKSAVRYYTKALSIYSEDPKIWNLKGCSLLELERHSAAIRCFDKALEIDKRDNEIWFNRGLMSYIQ